MVSFVQLADLAPDPTLDVGFWGLTFLAGCALWCVVRWLREQPSQPDPWDPAIAAELDQDGGVPLCHRCLAPHDRLLNFCPECGAPVGPFTNLLPYPYVFSIGHTLRIGTDGSFRRSPLTIAGFFLFSVAEYSVLAPLYWLAFLRRLWLDRAVRRAAE